MKTYTLEEIKELCKNKPGEPEIEFNNIGVSYPMENAGFIAASREIIPQLVGQLEKAIEALKYYYDKFWQEYCVGDRPFDNEDEFHRQTLKELGVE